MGLGVKMKRRSLWKGTHFKLALLGLALNLGYHGLRGISSFPTAAWPYQGPRRMLQAKFLPARVGFLGFSMWYT